MAATVRTRPFPPKPADVSEMSCSVAECQQTRGLRPGQSRHRAPPSSQKFPRTALAPGSLRRPVRGARKENEHSGPPRAQWGRSPPSPSLARAVTAHHGFCSCLTFTCGEVVLKRAKSFGADLLKFTFFFRLLRKRRTESPHLAVWPRREQPASLLPRAHLSPPVSGVSVFLFSWLFLAALGECHCRRRLTFHPLGTLTCRFSGCELNPIILCPRRKEQ